jgi:DoxX-like family
MYTAYIIVTVVAACMSAYAAYASLAHAPWILENMHKYGVPESWLFLLGVLLGSGAIGLLIGIGVHVIGSAAAIGLIAYFIGAFVTTARARAWSHLPYPVAFILPPAASLTLLLAST